MYTRPTWGGVDWFGCDDDLTWEPLDAPDPAPAAPARRSLPTATGRRAVRSAPVGGSSRPPRGSAPAAPAALAGPARRLLILDVENVCPSSRRPVRAMSRLRAVLRAAGPVDQIIAASAASQHTRLDELLRQAGVDVHLRCGNRPNAADRALILQARRFASEGDCEVVVASNDHGFRVVANLPGVRRVVLITQPQLATARSLLRVADERRIVA
jgi:NYN domain